MLTKLTVVVILQYIHVSDHVHLKLIHCHMSIYISIKNYVFYTALAESKVFEIVIPIRSVPAKFFSQLLSFRDSYVNLFCNLIR